MRVALVVVDRAGGCIASARMDGVAAYTFDFASGKAAFSGCSGRSTEEFLEARLTHSEPLWRAFTEDPRFFLVPGGHPLVVDGECLGGIGVSGAKYEDDKKVAEAAAGWLAAVASPTS
ncbi:MAG: heme-binding protein [Ilumatobacteraceae bacterium]